MEDVVEDSDQAAQSHAFPNMHSIISGLSESEVLQLAFVVNLAGHGSMEI